MKALRIHMIFLFITLTFIGQSCAQTATQVETKAYIRNPNFDETIKSYLDFSVPIISVDSLYKNYNNYILLDARAKSEYEVSHLPGAHYIGYKKPQLSVVKNLDTSKNIVLYCSIGYRSEVIAKKLQKKGYNVINLYGSIFEWVNKGYPLQDENGLDTKTVHGYDKSWSKWVENKEYKIFY
jgi:rhodanese-related sulfurtransferase